MKVVRKSNFDYEDHRGDQYFVAQRICERDARAIADLLNERAGKHSDNFYDVVADDYVLPPDWQP